MAQRKDVENKHATTTSNREASQLGNKAKDYAKEAKEKASKDLDKRTTDASRHVDSVKRALGSAASTLDEEGETQLAKYARSAQSQVERVGTYLRDESPERMVHDLEQSARKHPMAFLGTSFATGLLVGRFLRASENHETTEQESIQQHLPHPGVDMPASEEGMDTMSQRYGYQGLQREQTQGEWI